MMTRIKSSQLLGLLLSTAVLSFGCVEDSEPVDPPVPCTPDACGPTLGVPNMLCDDGVTVAGPGDCERQGNGQCGWTMVECPDDPEPCTPDECNGDQAADRAPVQACEDGSAPTPAECTRDDNGVCGWRGGGECPNEECTPDDCGPMIASLRAAPCEDGTEVTPYECVRQDDGMCGWRGGQCAPICGDGACGPEPDIDAAACPDGTAPTLSCEPQENGECGWSGPSCPDACDMILCERGSECINGDCVTLTGACADEECGPWPLLPDRQCDDGSQVRFHACERQDNGICELVENACPDEERCEPGSNIPAGDGCNTCTCPENGLVRDRMECTEAACNGECRSTDDCMQGMYCDFENDDCGVWGNVGTCQPRPEICPAGGVGVCGCDGTYRLNECELAGGGVDAMEVGGCGNPDGDGDFACGDMSCDQATELCTISMNDIAGPDQPRYFAACRALPEGCDQGDCSCASPEDFGECYEGTGNTIIFYPGG